MSSRILLSQPTGSTPHKDTNNYKGEFVRCIQHVNALEEQLGTCRYVQFKQDSLINRRDDSLRIKNVTIQKKDAKIKRKNRHMLHLGIGNAGLLVLLLLLI